MNLSKYVDMWMESHSIGLKPATVESYRQIVKLIKKQSPEININELNPLITPLIWSKQVKLGHLRTAQLIYTVLKMALNDAVRMGFIAENPLKFIKKPRNVAKNIQFLNNSQANSLLQSDSRFITAWALGLLAGMRRGEIAALRWSNIKGGKIAVVATRARIGKETIEGKPKSVAGRRFLPISAKLERYLTRAKLCQRRYCLENGLSWSEENYVITKDGSPLEDPRILNKHLAADLKRLGLPRISCHGLRHSYATAAVSAGIEMRVLQTLLGHEDIQTTAKYYAHVPQEILVNANSAISAIYT